MYKVIEVKQSIFEDNNKDADLLRQECKEKGVFLLNIMSSPGSGKTTTLSRTIETIKDEVNIGVMEADIDSDVDAHTISQYDVRTIQLHTGGMCHLDADMTRQGLHELGMENLDLAVLENVGNLVCPAEFDTGSSLNIAILSNKVDVLPYFDFDIEKCKENIHYRNKNAKVFEICAKSGEGVKPWCDYLLTRIREWKE